MKAITAASCAKKAILEIRAYEQACEDTRAKLLKDLEGRENGLTLNHLMGAGPTGQGSACAAEILQNMRWAKRTFETCEFCLKLPMPGAAEKMASVRAAYAKSFLGMVGCLHSVAKI